MKNTLITTICLAAGLTAAQAGQALASQQQPTTYSRTVKVSDLDLSQEQDARILVQRIRAASSRVCRQAAGGYETVSLISRGFQTCVREARNRAVADVNSPIVTAIYNSAFPFEVAHK